MNTFNLKKTQVYNYFFQEISFVPKSHFQDLGRKGRMKASVQYLKKEN